MLLLVTVCSRTRVRAIFDGAIFFAPVITRVGLRTSRSRRQEGRAFLPLLHLQQQSAIDIWQYTTEGHHRVDQSIQLFVATDGESQVTKG